MPAMDSSPVATRTKPGSPLDWPLTCRVPPQSLLVTGLLAVLLACAPVILGFGARHGVGTLVFRCLALVTAGRAAWFNPLSYAFDDHGIVVGHLLRRERIARSEIESVRIGAESARGSVFPSLIVRWRGGTTRIYGNIDKPIDRVAALVAERYGIRLERERVI